MTAPKRRLPAPRRFERLEVAQRQTNTHLASIDRTLETSSKLFVLMHERLEHLEQGQERIVDRLEHLEQGQGRLEEGQNRVVDRLDLLIEATTRDRTQWAERMLRVEHRLDAVEQRLDERT